jgi:tyrosine-protein phosphatase YwqE
MPLNAAYKILVNSYDTQQAADKEKLAISMQLKKNAYFTSHQDQEGYEIYSRKLGKFFVVTIEPIEDQKVLNTLLKSVRKRNRSAFISSSSKKPKRKNIPTIKKMEIKKVVVPKKVIKKEAKIIEKKIVPKVVTPVKQKVDNSKYLRKNIEKDSNTSGEYILFILLIVGLLTAAIILIILRKKYHQNSDSHLNEILFKTPNQEMPTQVFHSQYSAENLHVDLHSHLIPGIDDGSKSMEESVALIQKLHSFGYEKIITTPHVMMHRYPNSSNIITHGLAALQEVLRQKQINVKLEAAAEYFLDEHLMERVSKKDILTFGKNYLLFEMSYVNHPTNMEAMVQSMIDAGYIPVLAHPERYIYMSKNFSKYITLKALGVRFQLNLNSLTNYYSSEVKHIAKRLVDAGMINFVGSDTHRMKHLDNLQNVRKTQTYRDLFLKNEILNNTL